ncbi:hypothetical protein HRG_004029 [Hirsutella rhossiliensis]|uniref:Uncharacterized protein n=1 Tax=Hirsutella rhossiliensis TaxID=111463 RepID=A0A9P8N1N5_9HYPO|nr:uncharacterized protein HRG_04029 [Hirsutella rhossiliensis]KAH0966013.1 hypothetical protein HRG_04029 [Hirsutella rhossiliensis]
MATIVDILADMGSIAASMGAISPRLRNPTLRPSGQEVTQLHELAARILEHAQSLREKLTACAAQSNIRAAAQGQIKGSILKRNLVAIFQGHSASAVDSPSLKARKARKTEKGRVLRSLGAGPILAWAVSLPPSSWEEMDQLVFNDVARQMVDAGAGGEPVADIAVNVRDTIRELEREEPFCNIAPYGRFVEEVEELARSPRNQHQPKKRRLDTDGDAEDPSPRPEIYNRESLVPECRNAQAAPDLCFGDCRLTGFHTSSEHSKPSRPANNCHFKHS